MILKKALYLSKSIDKQRLAMYELIKREGLSNPEVIKLSQQLERKIILLQNLMLAIS
ncbi:aspartyl-phosphate phosphatase Spo0E family protein [Neobacillus vireti]|uniref:aspartyl-phosphate phosphatase Spo0E family protein n=1 Tax=Neobacillus vireti TaxID=220686 RepID=UPI002FFDF490